MPESFAEYMPHIRARQRREQHEWESRREVAWAGAHRAAELLRTRFGARQVIAFGSLVRLGPYDANSDIDLAVEGIVPRQFFRASAVEATAVGQFELDLIDLADCPARLRAEILREGVRL